MAVQTILGGEDVTEYVQEGSVTHRWNLNLDEASVRLHSDFTTHAENESLDIVLDGNLDFSGSVEFLEDDGNEDEMSSVFTAIDPSFIYNWRPARDADGDFSDPSFIEEFVTGPQIFQEVLQNSETYEGALGIALGSFAGGGADLTGAPTNWPMTLGTLGGLLCSTGLVDIVHTPTGGGGAVVDVYNGDFGSDLSGAVEFRYATGDTSNCSKCRRTIDQREIVNKLWDYLSPRKDQQHWWGGNITGDHPDLPDPPQATIAGMIAASRAAYRVRFLFQSWDQFSNVEEAAVSKPLYLRRWQMESALRSGPKVLVELTPDPGIAPSFRCGDKIAVTAGPRFRGGFSGAQRIMEYTYRWDTEGVVQLGAPIGQAGVPALTTTTSAEYPS